MTYPQNGALIAETEEKQDDFLDKLVKESVKKDYPSTVRRQNLWLWSKDKVANYEMKLSILNKEIIVKMWNAT